MSQIHAPHQHAPGMQAALRRFPDTMCVVDKPPQTPTQIRTRAAGSHARAPMALQGRLNVVTKAGCLPLAEEPPRSMRLGLRQIGGKERIHKWEL